jgi:hypothetical protein
VIMKKIKILAISFSAVTLLYLVALNGFNSPTSNFEGCYIQESIAPRDKVCIGSDGKLEQYIFNQASKSFELKGHGTWRSYTTTMNGEEYYGVVFNDFDGRPELDITPYENLLGDVLFTITNSNESADRFYTKE